MLKQFGPRVSGKTAERGEIRRNRNGRRTMWLHAMVDATVCQFRAGLDANVT